MLRACRQLPLVAQVINFVGWAKASKFSFCSCCAGQDWLLPMGNVTKLMLVCVVFAAIFCLDSFLTGSALLTVQGDVGICQQ